MVWRAEAARGWPTRATARGVQIRAQKGFPQTGVRTIWLVTDNHVPTAIDRRKAERHNIRIVDHREIFCGHEQLLPTFNSYAIETVLWRIEGLADRFLYFNDDISGLVHPTEGRRVATCCALSAITFWSIYLCCHHGGSRRRPSPPPRPQRPQAPGGS